MKRKVLKADAAGFCEGVARAVDAVRKRARDGEKLATLGPLVHNPSVVRELEELGVRSISAPEDYCKGETIVIRTHGVGPAVKNTLDSLGAKTLDLTCHRVARVQKLIAEAASQGRPVVIAGDPNHAESIGLKGFSGDRGVIIADPDSDFEMPSGAMTLVVSQTTQSPESFRRIADVVRRKASGVEVIDTICPFTVRRQDGIKSLIGKVDAAVVVGGKMSANTRRLVEAFEQSGVPVQHVETESELNFSSLADAEVIGVAAGASTPPEVVERVIHAIEQSDYYERH